MDLSYDILLNEMNVRRTNFQQNGQKCTYVGKKTKFIKMFFKNYILKISFKTEYNTGQ